MDRATLLKAFEANLWDRTAFLAKEREGAEIVDTSDLLMVDSGLPCRELNIIGRCTLHPRFAIDRIEAPVQRFRDKAFPFSWILGPLSGHGLLEPALKGLKLTCAEEEWIMGLPLDTGSVPGTSLAGFDIQRVATSEGVEDYAALMATTKDGIDENIKTFYADAKEIIMGPSPLRHYLGYVGAEPVAALEAFNAHGVFSFHAMATQVATRGKGYGPALLIHALREAKKAGLRMACVQTPEAGRALYERVGFKPAGRIATYT